MFKATCSRKTPGSRKGSPVFLCQSASPFDRAERREGKTATSLPGTLSVESEPAHYEIQSFEKVTKLLNWTRVCGDAASCMQICAHRRSRRFEIPGGDAYHCTASPHRSRFSSLSD